MTDTTMALVTGANKGIGFEIARGLGGLGWAVGVGARDPGRLATAVDRLRADGVDAFAVPLDVTDDASVAAAARQLEERGGLDVLVDNAGVTGELASQLPGSVDLDTLRGVLEVNVFGVIRTLEAFLPQLRRSPHPRIVAVSSGVGSLARQSDPEGDAGPISLAYSPSKTYLNAIVVQYARALRDTPVKINLVCPGFVATDLNGFRGTRTPEQGAQSAVRLAQIPDDGPSGGYFEDAGVIPW